MSKSQSERGSPGNTKTHVFISERFTRFAFIKFKFKLVWSPFVSIPKLACIMQMLLPGAKKKKKHPAG